MAMMMVMVVSKVMVLEKGYRDIGYLNAEFVSCVHWFTDSCTDLVTVRVLLFLFFNISIKCALFTGINGLKEIT